MTSSLPKYEVLMDELNESNNLMESPQRSNEPFMMYALQSESELRFEVTGKVSLVLKSGLAEIYGTEIVIHRKYIFIERASIAVFTYHGCVLEIVGNPKGAYIATDTPMIFYSNIHYYLETLRKEAENNYSKGPTVMIVGPNDVGKSTLCRILLNYAVRQGRKPIFADLDVGLGEISVPGTVGAILIERHADIEEGFHQEGPLVYYVGQNVISENISLYKLMISRLAKQVISRASSLRASSINGIIINSCGYIQSRGYEALLHAVKAFEVDIIFSIDQERLYNELKKDLPPFVKIMLTPKSGGAIDRSDDQRIAFKNSSLKKYFYGLKIKYHPHSFTINFSDFKIFRVVHNPLLVANGIDLISEDEFPQLINRIISISAANTSSSLLSSNIIGFICATNVDMALRTLTVLSPRSRPLPNHLLILSDVLYLDNN